MTSRGVECLGHLEGDRHPNPGWPEEHDIAVPEMSSSELIASRHMLTPRPGLVPYDPGDRMLPRVTQLGPIRAVSGWRLNRLGARNDHKRV